MPTATPTLPAARRLLNKVPEVTLWFWIIKILCTTVGESFASGMIPANAVSAASTKDYRLLDHAWRAHPERFNRRPKPPTLPARAGINDPRKRTPTTTPNLSHTG